MEVKIPATYQEWLEYMKKLEAMPVYEEDILLLEQGSLPPGGFVADKFQAHVVETVDVMLKRYVRKFNRLVNESMELGTVGDVQILCLRLRREMGNCFFFKHIRFLEKEFARELEKELNLQITLFWKRELREIIRLNEQAYYPELEDLIYSMRRMQRGSGV